MKKLLAIVLSMILSVSMLVCFTACDPATVEEECSTEDCSVIDEEESSASADDFSKNVVIDTKDFTFFIDGAEHNEKTNIWSVKVYMENKTDKPITFSWKSVNINKKPIDPSWSYAVKANEKDTDTVEFDMTIFDANDIDRVEFLSFILSVCDEKGKVFNNTEYVFSLAVEPETTK